ncbi:predicted protein [Naegleria gruberi]|uniref:Predicted protein n=1 Tax=Naegleria gruberi TaxID=5762 RepID=D2VXK9_NAEGR|nr:uncharacterized protein NAEGRDRAFT_81613 [Naegleria gruberi]EFC38458.1 predicted protein [Naegleria gruberi]|eukprot:XP_002671202.1 predicted protein [Naegleria gruberi strain NEG-M]
MCQIMMRSTSFEEEEETSDEEQQEHTSPIHADEEETAEQSSSEDEEEEIMLAEDDDLLTQQNNHHQHHPNEEEEEEDLNNQQEEAAPIIEEEQEDEDSDSTKLSSPVISTHHNNQHNTSTANSSSGAAEESIQIDEDDLETLRRDDHMENGLLECDEEMDYLLNDEKIMMPQTPLLINNDNFTTPNSAGSVTVAMPFLDDVDGCVESKPLNENEIECKLECNIVTTEEVSEKENVELATESSVLQMNQPIAHNSESLIENRQTISIADEQMNVLVMEDDQIVVNQEVIEKPSLIQQQETQPNNTDIISSINLDEDLDIEMINDFLQSEKGADLCEEHSKENSPHGDSISNQSMNDSWNTNYTTDSLGSTMHHRQPMQGCTPLISRKNFNHHAQSIPLEDLLQNYDHRIEYSTLEMLIKELEGIGVYTVNSLPLVPKKHIMALPVLVAEKYLPIELGDPISKLWLFKHNLKLYDICPLLLGSENALTHSPILFFCRETMFILKLSSVINSWNNDKSTHCEIVEELIWEEIIPNNVMKPPVDQYSSCYDKLSQFIYLLGGSGNLWKFDLKTKTWANIVTVREIPINQTGHSIMYTNGKLMWNSKSYQSYNYYDPICICWQDSTRFNNILNNSFYILYQDSGYFDSENEVYVHGENQYLYEFDGDREQLITHPVSKELNYRLKGGAFMKMFNNTIIVIGSSELYLLKVKEKSTNNLDFFLNNLKARKNFVDLSFIYTH